MRSLRPKPLRGHRMHAQPDPGRTHEPRALERHSPHTGIRLLLGGRRSKHQRGRPSPEIHEVGAGVADVVVLGSGSYRRPAERLVSIPARNRNPAAAATTKHTIAPIHAPGWERRFPRSPPFLLRLIIAQYQSPIQKSSIDTSPIDTNGAPGTCPGPPSLDSMFGPDVSPVTTVCLIRYSFGEDGPDDSPAVPDEVESVADHVLLRRSMSGRIRLASIATRERVLPEAATSR